MSSYLINRTQYIAIGSKQSSMRTIAQGVPQGSVLGPTLYNLFINEMGDIVNKYGQCEYNIHRTSEKLFSNNCNQCGTIFGYADDATYISTSNSRFQNLENIKENIRKIQDFLEANKMNINTSKTILMELMLH